jgi:hypothetical protein
MGDPERCQPGLLTRLQNKSPGSHFIHALTPTLMQNGKNVDDLPCPTFLPQKITVSPGTSIGLPVLTCSHLLTTHYPET